MNFIKKYLAKIFLFVALFAVIGGAFFALKTNNVLNKKSAEAKESARPANLEITIISTPNCENCFNINGAVDNFKKQNVLVDSEKQLPFDSPEAQIFIQKFAIQKVPTYIAIGEIEKKNIENFVKNNGEIRENTFIFTKIVPVYIDPASKKEFGHVQLTYITDPSCAQCLDFKPTINAYKKAGVKFIEEKSYPWNSSEGQKLIRQYKIIKIPTIVMSSGIAFYDQIKQVWQNIGTVENDGVYVARNIPLPYRDTGKGLVGFVDVIYLKDFACADCYKPEEIHKNVLRNGYGIGIRSEKAIDIASAEGKNIVKKYQITKIPTMLVSPGISEYSNLAKVWPQVGTAEKDGWYVFRQMEQLGSMVYKDLSTNQIIRPQPTKDNETP